MKAIKLIIPVLFFTVVCRAQYNWTGLIPTSANGLTYNVFDVAFDSTNNAYLVGENYLTSNWDLFYNDGNSWYNYTDTVIGYGKMQFDNNGALWFAGSYPHLLSGHNSINHSVVGLPFDSATYYQHAYDFTIDANNNKWLLTTKYPNVNSLSMYVCKYSGTSWTVYDSTVTSIQSYSSNYYYPLRIKASKISTLIYTIGSPGYIVKYDGSTWSKLDSSNSNLIGGITIKDAVMDHNDNLWLLTYSFAAGSDILIKYDGVQFYYYYQPAPLLNMVAELGSLAVDSLNNIWIYNVDQGLVKFDGTNWVAHNSFTEGGLSCPTYNAKLTPDKKGNIWITNEDNWSSFPVIIYNESGFQNITGKVFNDVNANGVQDINESGIKNEMITTSAGTNCISDSMGNFGVFFMDSNATITVNHPLHKYRYHSTLPTSYTVIPITQSTTGKDFGVAGIPNVTDVTVTGYFFPTRPGFNSYGGIDYENIGTTTVSDTITLQLDNNYTFLNSAPSPDFTNGNKLQWLFNNLSPLSYGHISLNLYVSASVNIGDTLFSTVSINPIIGDTVPGDNTDYISKIVTGSFDPNEKEVEPKGIGAAGNITNGETLSYTIHFQNTGTDTAFTVSISDTLSTNLDISSFQFIGSTHPVVTEIKGTVNLKFTFYNILLPDSNTNEPLSQGYVSYKIKAIDNLPLGTQIKNTAYIYFDFNAPVVTNTILNTIANPTGFPFLKNDYSANVFPNPVQDISTLEINGMDLNSKLTLKLYDVLGHEKNIAVSKIANNRFAIHRADLVSGLYFYKVSDGSVLISSGKITIQ